MSTKTKKVNIDPSATTHNIIDLLSSGIDNISTLLSTTARMTPNKKTLHKNDLPDIRVVPKIDHGEKILFQKVRFT